jgi:hypothetical protein
LISNFFVQSLFDDKSAVEIVNRIDQLKPDSQRLWGKMNVAQMLAHCSAALETATGKKIPREFL